MQVYPSALVYPCCLVPAPVLNLAAITRRSASCSQNPAQKLPAEAAYRPCDTAQLLPRLPGTTRQKPLSPRCRDNHHRPGRESFQRSTDPPPTTPRSWRISRSLSCLRLLNRTLHGPHLVMLGIIAHGARYCDRFGNLWVNEVSVATLPAARHKACPFQLGDKLPHLRRHRDPL